VIRRTLAELPISEAPVAILDLEMTGLDPEKDRICEVGVVRARGGVVEERFQSLVRPEVPVTPGARAVHGIPDAALADAPPFEAVIDEVERMIEGTLLVAHHVTFDLSFLDAAFGRCGRTVPDGPRFDTLEVARRTFAFRSHKLDAVCQALAVEEAVTHRALDDAIATAGVFSRMVSLLDPGGKLTIGGLQRLVDDLERGSPMRQAQERALQEGLARKRTVWFDYLSPTLTDGFIRTRREVQVWAIKPPRLQGWCYLRNAERIFRLERIHEIELGYRSYEIPSFTSRL
jgi:DNA polymerase-3 subunit epsilon